MFFTVIIRFGMDMNSGQLSPWLLPHIKIHENFGSFQKDVLLFFKNASSKVSDTYGHIHSSVISFSSL